MRLFGISVALLITALTPSLLEGCSCVPGGDSSVCRAFERSDIIFTGRVETTDPDFDPRSPDTRKQLAEAFPGVDLDTADLRKFPELFPKVRQLTAELFSEPRRSRVLAASNPDQLDAIWDEGVRATFRITKRYKGLTDTAERADIWTSLSSCGVHFVKGETYLVYANQSGNGQLEVRRCYNRTTRVTDAGDDLAYLHFRETGGTDITRVFGFVTKTEDDVRGPFYKGFASQRVTNIVVELRSAEKILIDHTSKAGAFAFDGLVPGDYMLTVFKSYSDEPKPLIEPRRIRISEEKCVEEKVYVPKP